MIGLAILFQVLLDRVWVTIGIGVDAWALAIWRYRLLEKIRGRRFRTGLRILAFVVWFCVVFGVAMLPWWPENWAVGYAIVAVAILFVAALGLERLERRDLSSR